MKTEWEKVTLGEVATISSGSTPSRSNASFWNGTIPWVTTTQIQNNIINLNDVKEFITDDGLKKSSLKIIPKGTLLMAMYGQGKTRGQVGILNFDSTINQACAAIKVSQKVSSLFLYQYFQFKYEDIRALSNSGGQKNLSAEIIKSIEFHLPPFSEQEKIVNTLSIWDSAIEKTEKLIEKKESLLNWYAKRILISGKTSKVLFSDLFKLSSEKNTLNQSYPALSVTKDGVVFQEEYFNKRVASEDTSNYLIARRNTFVFSGLNFWMGSVDLQTLTDVGIISPAYKVFSINSDLISYEYAHFLIRSNYMKRLLMDSSIVGASIVRRNLDMDNLLNSAIELPTLEQQSKIVEQLSIIQKDIELNKMLLNQYKLQKQGLMQKLLTGEWRVK